MTARRVLRAGHQLEERRFTGGGQSDESGVQHKLGILARTPQHGFGAGEENT
jgi:hypothetical protein